MNARTTNLVAPPVTADRKRGRGQPGRGNAVGAPKRPAERLANSDLVDLLRRIERHDGRALEALYDATSRAVYALARHIVPDAATVEEVVSDVYLRVWRHARHFVPERGTVRTWLMIICRGRALDAARAQRLRDLRTTDFAIAENRDEADLDLLMRAWEGSRVHLSLYRLRPVQRQCVALAFFRGLSHSEIAVHLDLPLGTVKSHLRSAIADLRDVLGTSSVADEE